MVILENCVKKHKDFYIDIIYLLGISAGLNIVVDDGFDWAAGVQF